MKHITHRISHITKLLCTLYFVLCTSFAYSAETGRAQARVGVAMGRGVGAAGVQRHTASSGISSAAAQAAEIPDDKIRVDEDGNEYDCRDAGENCGNGGKNPEPEPDPVVVIEPEPEPEPQPVVGSSKTCRDDYRECMDAYCLLDESEGDRCVCSANISKSKSLIKKISDTQAKAEKLYSEGVEKEKLGAQAVLVFGQSEKAKSRIDLSLWLNNDEEGNLDDDFEIGEYLYEMAAKSCQERLSACGKDAAMEEQLYGREIAKDCTQFTKFLGAQQKVADNNLAAAERAIRAARHSMLETTNKYNRGECLIALRNCVAEKGGCGDNFENCLDRPLLTRRTNACDNILDQCMAVRKDVKKDWEEEMNAVLEDAVKYADRYQRQTCLSRIESCLEDSCSTTTNDQCLNNVDVAAGVCPVITDCDTLIPGIKDVVDSKLGYLRVRFCQNDITACFRDKCGVDYTNPQCLGKPTSEIVALCPQDMYPSCQDQTQFDVLVSSILLQMDYAQVQGCVNAFSDALGRVCGLDMSCVPEDPSISTLKSVEEAEAIMKPNENGINGWKQFASAEVEKIFADLEKDSTIGACAENLNPKTKVKGKIEIGTSVFNTAKMIATVNAEQRQYRALTSKIRELAAAADLDQARKACEIMKEDDKIDSAVFEPSLRNCHVCRTQKVCEQGGETGRDAMMKGFAGGAAAGASMGTMVSPGWGTVIGGAVGGVGMGLMSAAGKIGNSKWNELEEFCQEIQSCEDINM